MCDLKPHFLICIVLLIGKTRPHNITAQGLSAVLGVSPLRNVFLRVCQ